MLKIHGFEKICIICNEIGDFIGFSNLTGSWLNNQTGSVIALLEVRFLIFGLL